VDDQELARATNLGVGMVVVLPPTEADRATAFLAGHDIPAWVMGEVASRLTPGRTRIRRSLEMSRIRSLAIRSAASLVGTPSALARWKMSRTAL
jgi:hypothetical protein